MPDSTISTILISFGSAIVGGAFTLVGGYFQSYQAQRSAKRERIIGLYQDLISGVYELETALELFRRENSIHRWEKLSSSEMQDKERFEAAGVGRIHKVTNGLSLVVPDEIPVFKLSSEFIVAYGEYKYKTFCHRLPPDGVTVSEAQVDKALDRFKDASSKLRVAIRSHLDSLDKPFWRSLPRLPLRWR